MLLLSDIQPSPGPLTSCDFKNMSGLHIMHINARRLLSEIDVLRIWASSTGADIVLSPG